MISGALGFFPATIPIPTLPPFDFSPHTNEIGAPKSLSDGFKKGVESLLFDGFDMITLLVLYVILVEPIGEVIVDIRSCRSPIDSLNPVESLQSICDQNTPVANTVSLIFFLSLSPYPSRPQIDLCPIKVKRCPDTPSLD